MATCDVTVTTGDADQPVAVDDDALRVLVEARECSSRRHARCRIRRHRSRMPGCPARASAGRRRSARSRFRRTRRSARPRSADAAMHAHALERARADRAGRLGSRIAGVSVIAAGSALPTTVTSTSPGSELSICVRLKNSLAVPRADDGVADRRPPASPTVNTKMPCDVGGLASAVGIGVCRKKPLDFHAGDDAGRDHVLVRRAARTQPSPWMS